MNILSTVTGYGSSPVNITKREERFIDATFKEELKRSRQNATTRRNDDNGYGAALTCLARDMVTATPEEAALIAAKINFIQNQINQNLRTDANLRTQRNDDSRAMIETKSSAYARKAPRRAEVIKATTDGLVDVVDSVDKVITTINPVRSMPKAV